jgi:ribosomal protein S27E
VSSGEEEKIFTLGGGIHEYHVATGQTTEVGEGNLLTFTPDGKHVYYLGPEQGIFLFEEGRPPMRVPGTQEGGYIFGPKGNGGQIFEGQTAYGETENMPVTTPDGSNLLFVDAARLTEYDNCPEFKGTKACHHEVYVYDANTNRVTCVSCSPANLSPQGQAQLIDGHSLDVSELQYQTPSPPFISDDGSRAVFETTEALVPQDLNGTEDVYEWERAGTNGCAEESTAYSPVIEGCVYMLSSGLGREVPNENGIADGTHLVGASENLQDVYIQTSESLLPGLDNASKLYDVRIDGGFPYTPPSHGCEAAQCELPAGESELVGGSGTEAFAGLGNVKSGAARLGRRSSAVRRERLAHALRFCRRDKSRRRRERCEQAARRRYAVKNAARLVHGAGGR